MGKNFDVAILLDFYGQMLTPKQYNVIDLYYNQDLSLSEIAEHENITRQGVRDSIKRGENLLFDLEEKIHLLQTYFQTADTMKNIRYVIERIFKENQDNKYSIAIDDNAKQILQIIDNYNKQNS